MVFSEVSLKLALVFSQYPSSSFVLILKKLEIAYYCPVDHCCGSYVMFSANKNSNSMLLSAYDVMRGNLLQSGRLATVESNGKF